MNLEKGESSSQGDLQAKEVVDMNPNSTVLVDGVHTNHEATSLDGQDPVLSDIPATSNVLSDFHIYDVGNLEMQVETHLPLNEKKPDDSTCLSQKACTYSEEGETNVKSQELSSTMTHIEPYS